MWLSLIREPWFSAWASSHQVVILQYVAGYQLECFKAKLPLKRTSTSVRVVWTSHWENEERNVLRLPRSDPTAGTILNLSHGWKATDFERITTAIETELRVVAVYPIFLPALSVLGLWLHLRPLSLSFSQARRHYPITCPTWGILRMRRIWMMKMRLRKRNHPVWHPHRASLHPRRENRPAKSMDSVSGII